MGSTAVKDFYYWVCGRAMEATTWFGLALITISGFGLTSTNPTVQQCLGYFNSYGPTVGAFLVATTERRHREEWKAEGK